MRNHLSSMLSSHDCPAEEREKNKQNWHTRLSTLAEQLNPDGTRAVVFALLKEKRGGGNK